MSLRLSSIALVAALAACAGDAAPPDPDYSCTAQPDVHCDHPIDQIVVPRLRAAALPIRDATGDELCRRMAIDLIGRAPTPAERAACAGAPAEAIFDAFTADADAYARHQAKLLAEEIGVRFDFAYPLDIVDLDAGVRDAYRGTITYAELVEHVAMHGAFEGHHPGDSWTSALYWLFLGRGARADEIAALHPITEPWTVRALIDGTIWWNWYDYTLTVLNSPRPPPPDLEATAIASANAFAEGNIRREWAINPCRCRPRPGFLGCTTDALGEPIEITATCTDAANPDAQVNWRRVGGHTPRRDDKCPDGSYRYECSDRSLARDGNGNFLPLVQLAPAEPALADELAGVGRALVARGDLWEAAADRELKRLLGYWQTTFKHPDSDIPEVRDLLAARLRDGASLRDIQRLIVTSLLYDQPAASPEGATAETAPWAAGPTKVLYGEEWFRSMVRPLGFGDPICDYRWLQPLGPAQIAMHPDLVETNGFPMASAQGLAELMPRVGGCAGDLHRPDVTNLGMVFNYGDLARLGCAVGQPLAGWTDTWTGDYAAAVRELIGTLWAREPRPGEVDAMVAEMTACRAAGAGGCVDDAAAVGWMCVRMIDSGEFATY
jgi:hypothetical protein